jgi:hypothetical protein
VVQDVANAHAALDHLLYCPSASSCATSRQSQADLSAANSAGSSPSSSSSSSATPWLLWAPEPVPSASELLAYAVRALRTCAVDMLASGRLHQTATRAIGNSIEQKLHDAGATATSLGQPAHGAVASRQQTDKLQQASDRLQQNAAQPERAEAQQSQVYRHSAFEGIDPASLAETCWPLPLVPVVSLPAQSEQRVYRGTLRKRVSTVLLYFQARLHSSRFHACQVRTDVGSRRVNKLFECFMLTLPADGTPCSSKAQQCRCRSASTRPAPRR